MGIDEAAEKNFQSHLGDNPYPGRGLVIGRPEEDTWVILYWIMGRSANSRNRRFVAEGDRLRTEPVDPALVKDPSLIIYDAMLDLPGVYLVSNGDQTRTMYDALKNGGTIEEALSGREREPDAPNFTPRINGMLRIRESSASTVLAILKANAIDPAFTDRYYYYPAMPAVGFGPASQHTPETATRCPPLREILCSCRAGVRPRPSWRLTGRPSTPRIAYPWQSRR